MNYENYQLNQTVWWRGGYGHEAPKQAKIIDFGEKNDRPTVSLDNGHWAYLDQIQPVRG